MRKQCQFTLLIILLVFYIPPFTVYATDETPKYKQMYDALLSALNPSIEKAITSYHKEIKQYGLYDTKILDIERVYEDGSGFKVKIQVETFEHAHNPPYGKETVTMDVSTSGVKVVDFQHEGDEWEKKREEFYERIIHEIKQSFQLDLDSYTAYTYGQLVYAVNQQKGYKSLLAIVEDIMINTLKQDITPPYKNVTNPVTFVKEQQAYILFKRADGTNVVYTVKQVNNIWQITDKESKQGKRMEMELLWYM